MSDSAPNEPPSAQASRAYRELATLVRHLADELAGFRRRAFAAEAELRARATDRSRDGVDSGPGPSRASLGAIGVAEAESVPAPSPLRPPSVPSHGDDRVAALERENAELRKRVEQASTRTRQLIERVRFLRQQHVVGG